MLPAGCEAAGSVDVVSVSLTGLGGEAIKRASKVSKVSKSLAQIKQGFSQKEVFYALRA
jgi:hypothetical protein